MFGLDAKIINYVPGLRFAFVKERNSGQNGLAISLQNPTVIFFKRKHCIQSLAQCALQNTYFKNNFSILNEAWRITCSKKVPWQESVFIPHGCEALLQYQERKVALFPSCCFGNLREEVTKALSRIKFLPFCISTQMNTKLEKEQTVSLTCVDSAVVQKLISIFFWYSIKQLQC